MSESNVIIGNKRISELNPLGKLTGKEEIIIDNGDETHKVTIDSLLGYIANQINSGTFPPSILDSTNIIVIPEGEDIPISSRKEGNFYFKVKSSDEINLNGGITGRIAVSPNMGLKVIS